MKRFLCFLVFVAVFSIAAYAINNRYDDKRIRFRKDWVEFYEAQEKDLPKTQEKILKRIMDKAASDKACLDLFYAFDEYLRMAGYDFKDKDKRLDYVYEVIDGLSPVQLKMLMCLRMMDEHPARGADSLTSWLEKYREELCGAKYVTKELASIMFYGIDDDFHYIDDYEFFLSSYITVYGVEGDKVPMRYVDELLEYRSKAGDEYMINLVSSKMMKAGREVRHASVVDSDRELIRRFYEIAEECGDNPAKMLPLSSIAYRLTYIYPETEEECLEADSFLRQTIDWAEKKLSEKGLRPYERHLLVRETGYIESYMENLREKTISDQTAYFPYPAETEIVLAMKNCSDVRVRIEKSDSTLVMDTVVHCPGERSFGIPDTVSVMTLPALEDGYYYIRYDIVGEESGKWAQAHRYLDVSSYAVAVRSDAGGVKEFYLTDAKTGQPVERSGFTVEFDDRGRDPFSGVMDFDGFTELPVDLDCYARLSFVSPDGKRSPAIPVYPARPYYSGSRPYDASYGEFFLDRKLFRPGEEVSFKYIAYRSDGKSLVAEEGKQVSVGLYAADGRKIDSLSAVTNGFGSFSGSFDIPENLMNGMFSIRTGDGVMEYFRVENAEPPTFTASFDPVEGIFRYDDTLTVTGHVRSYRGYGADGVRIAYTVEDRWYYEEFSGETYTGADGSFSIPVVMTAGYISINAVATLPDGESLELRKSLVTDEYGVELALVTDALEASGDGGFYFRKPDSLVFTLEADNMDGVALDSLDCDYSVFRIGADGMKHLVQRGTALSGSGLAIDTRDLETGGYRVYASMEVEGLRRSVLRDFVLLDTGAFQDYPDMERPYVFLPDTSGAYYIGARDSLWVLTEYFDSNTGELLEIRHDTFAPGIRRVVEGISDVYPGRDFVRSLFVVKDGEAKVFRTDIAGEKDYVLDMEISSLRKVTTSGVTEHFTLVFPELADAEVLVDIFDKASEDIVPNNYYFAPENVLRRAYIPYASAYFGGAGYRRDYGFSLNAVAMKSSSASPVARNEAVMDGAVVEEAARVSEAGSASDGLADYIPEDILRKDFSSTLAFYPHLRPDAEGRLEVEYATSARLSTFVVQILAHDRSMRHAVARDEVVVKKELMVSASVPDFLREGDCPALVLTVKNDMSLPASGRFVVEMYDASCGVGTSAAPVFLWESEPMMVEAGKTAVEKTVLPEIGGNISEYVLRFAFIGENDTKVSDAEEHTVPVVSSDVVAVNTVSAISDAHDGDISVDVSGLLDGEPADGGAAVYRIDISTPVSAAVDAMPVVLAPSSGSLTDWTDALVTMKIAEMLLAEKPGMADYIKSIEPEDLENYRNTPWYTYMSRQNDRRALLDSLLSPSWRQRFAAEAVGKISGFRYSNGAFSWFPGGKPSVYMTLMLLERYAVAEDFGIAHSREEAEYISDAIGYLDGEFSSYMENMSDSVGWRKYSSRHFDSDGFVHDYMFVRSFYRNSVAFSGTAGRFYEKCEKLMAKRASKADVSSKIKYARVLLNGDRYAGSRRMADIVASLYEHASEDRWGNLCFSSGAPRIYGMFDSGIYVNSSALMLFDRLEAAGFDDRKGTSGKISSLISGTERHLLSLKEGLDWGDGIRTSVAVAALVSRSAGDFPVKHGSIVTDEEGLASMADEDGILRIPSSASDGRPASESGNMKIVSVSKIWSTKIWELDDASNGISVRREFYRRPLASSALEPLSEGSSLETGDVVVCKYVIDNDEARSFVRLGAMRPACFAVSDIRSGYTYSWKASLSSYRDIRDSGTDYYIDYLPEGVTEITEEFFVSVPGVFSAGNVEAVSLYVPQYGGRTAVQKVVSAL